MAGFDIVNVLGILEEARQFGVIVSAENDELLVSFPKNERPELLLSKLREFKPQIIDYIKRQKAALVKEPMPVLERPERIPLSFSQERLWFIDQLQGTKQYHLSWILRAHGPLNVEAIDYSFRQVIERHEILRTVTQNQDGVGFQEIRKITDWKISLAVLQDILFNGRSLESYVEEFVSAPFDLAAEPMIRVAVVKESENVHLIAIVIHHIAFDGWSTSILVDELLMFYKNKVEQKILKLNPLHFQYSDFAIWQRTYLSGDFLDAHLRYWKTKLSGVQPLALVTDFDRLNTTSNASKIESKFDKSLTRRIKELVKTEGVTMFMSFVAVLNVLLYRYTGQSDVCIGTPVAGRNDIALEGLIGFFVNTIAIRNTVSPQLRFRDFLQQVKKSILEDFEHQDAPFEKVVDILALPRDMMRSSVFQVMISYQNTPPPGKVEIQSVRFEPIDIPGAETQFEMSINIVEYSEEIHFNISFFKDLFQVGTITGLARHLQNLFSEIVKNPDTPIYALQLIDEDERNLILSTFNNTSVPLSMKKNVVDLLEDQAGRTPDHMAVFCDEVSITYLELEHRANQLAQYLKTKGVGPEDLVPIVVDRSVNLVIAIVAVMKAGAAYIPIDLTTPVKRIQFILNATKPKIGLTVSGYSEKSELQKCIHKIVEIDNEEEIGQCLTTKLQRTLDWENLAYVIYTSGSTGIPKGVMVEHRSLVNVALAWQSHYGLDKQGLVVLSVASSGFDVFTGDLCRALLNGGTLVLVPEDRRLDIPYLLDEISRHQVSVIESTPAMAMMLASYIEYDNLSLPSLKLLIVGSDTIHAKDFKSLQETFKNCRVINSYGITEATIDSSYFEGNLFSSTVPIGKPIDNTKFYILDDFKNIVPIGVKGDLYIAGAGVTRGYLNPSSEEIRRFSIDPFETSGGRIFKTGDKARWLNDGNVEFLGRDDNQLKIRGYRVELGEIENVLGQAPTVKQAIVAVKKNEGGDNEIVAYLVAMESIDRTQIIYFLRSKLPHYMIPAHFIELQELPITVNGKIDRSNLPDVESSPRAAGDTSPSNKIEEILVSIWGEILGRTINDVTSDVVAMSHSLLLIRAVSLIRKRTHATLNIRDLFLNPTIRSISELVYQRTQSKIRNQEKHSQHIVLLNSYENGLPIFLVPGSEGLVDGYSDLAVCFNNKAPVFGIQMNGIGEDEIPFTNIREIASENIRWLQESFSPPYRFISHSFGVHVMFEMVKQLESMNEGIDWGVGLDMGVHLESPGADHDRSLFMLNAAKDLFLSGKDFFIDAKKVAELQLIFEMPNLRDMLAMLRNFAVNLGIYNADEFEFKLRMFAVQLCNLKISHTVTGRVKSKIIIARAIGGRLSMDDCIGWGSHCEDFSIIEVPGDHRTMVKAPNAEQVYKGISDILHSKF